MSHLDTWLKANPIEMHRLTALTKAKTPSMNNPGPAWSELMVCARVKLELGEVVDLMEGLLQASQEHPELRQAYEAEQLACLPGAARHETDDDGLLKHRKEAGMDTPPTTATATLMTRIAKRQQEAPDLSFQDASTQVFREDRMLYEDYLAEQRGLKPLRRQVETRELPAESTVQEMVAKQMFQHPTMSTQDAWQVVLKAHEGREEFNTVWECYRRYQTSAAALRDHDAAVLAKGRARP